MNLIIFKGHFFDWILYMSQCFFFFFFFDVGDCPAAVKIIVFFVGVLGIAAFLGVTLLVPEAGLSCPPRITLRGENLCFLFLGDLDFFLLLLGLLGERKVFSPLTIFLLVISPASSLRSIMSLLMSKSSRPS